MSESLHAAAVLASMPAAFILFAPGNIILDVNEAAEDLLATSRSVLCGGTLPSPGRELLASLLEDFWRAPSHLQQEIRWRDSAIIADIAPVPSGGALFLTIRRGLGPTDQTVPLEEIASLLGHEIKNPLSGMRGAAQLLAAHSQGPDRELAHLIVTEVDRIAALIDSYGAEEDAQPTVININELVEHCLAIARHGFAAQATIESQFDPSMPPVIGYRGLLTQAVLNLLKNGAEAGSMLRVRTAYGWGPLVAQPGQRRTRLALAIEIEDNGPGVDPAVISRMFEPFVSTKRASRGLGLAVVARAAHKHGGKVDYRHAPTIFRLLLPIAIVKQGEEAA
ncbi:MAG TPA: ATP-binding protein [Dongiaceae bacterium]|nr:ATP-binding protein [Dongiaceae bacterium]